MKKKNILSIILFSAIFTLTACSKDSNVESDARLLHFSNSGCKSYETTRGTEPDEESSFFQETVVCKAVDNNRLRIIHQHAVLCCEIKINVTVTVAGNKITITEEQPPLTNCICFYDLDMVIGPLENTRYELIIHKNKAIYESISFDYSPAFDATYKLEDTKLVIK